MDPQGGGRSWWEAQKGASSGGGFGYLSFGQKAEMASPKMACARQGEEDRTGKQSLAKVQQGCSGVSIPSDSVAVGRQKRRQEAAALRGSHAHGRACRR